MSVELLRASEAARRLDRSTKSSYASFTVEKFVTRWSRGSHISRRMHSGSNRAKAF